MHNIESVIFDVDGVLLDSLDLHLAICRDKSTEFGLGLKIPDAEEFRRMVRNKIKISPMDQFFLAVGFSIADAKRATDDYNRDFMRDYTPAAFKGTHAVLEALHDAGLHLGIVTSNVRRNIENALCDSMALFDPRLILTHDEPGVGTKVDALRIVAQRLGTPPSTSVYVGDQPNDWLAARDAGFQFVGVTYGWGISQFDCEYPTLASLSAVCDYILSSVNGPVGSNPVSDLEGAQENLHNIPD